MPNKSNKLSKNGNCNLITKEEAVSLAKSAISPDAELVDYKIGPYSEVTLGFTGSIQKLVLEAHKPGETGNETRSFFLKTMPIGMSAQANCASENGTFMKETEFFRDLEPLMLQNYKSEPWVPKCYLVKENHTLVFEDIGVKGFCNREKFLDEDCVMSTVACVARLHASSLLAEEKLNGKSLIELYPKIFEESEYRRTGRNYEWFTASVNYLILLAEEMDLDSSRLSKVCDRVFDAIVPSKTKRNVLSHGDLWSNNLMFDEANRCRLVDFQLMRYLPLAHDVMLHLYFCTPRGFREKNEARVLDHYYKTLQETLKVCDYKGEVPSFEELKQGVEEQRLPALIIAAISFQIILIDSKMVSNIMNNSDKYETYFFKSRKPIIDEIMAVDPLFAKRVKDITRELVEASLSDSEFPELT